MRDTLIDLFGVELRVIADRNRIRYVEVLGHDWRGTDITPLVRESDLYDTIIEKLKEAQE